MSKDKKHFTRDTHTHFPELRDGEKVELHEGGWLRGGILGKLKTRDGKRVTYKSGDITPFEGLPQPSESYGFDVMRERERVTSEIEVGVAGAVSPVSWDIENRAKQKKEGIGGWAKHVRRAAIDVDTDVAQATFKNKAMSKLSKMIRVSRKTYDPLRSGAYPLVDTDEMLSRTCPINKIDELVVKHGFSDEVVRKNIEARIPSNPYISTPVQQFSHAVEAVKAHAKEQADGLAPHVNERDIKPHAVVSEIKAYERYLTDEVEHHH